MKRGFLVLALAAFVAGGVFADSLFSVGGGFSFDGGRLGSVPFEGSDSGAGWSESWSGFEGFNATGFGGHVFFDMTFVEFSIGLMGGPMHGVMHEEFSWTDNGDSGSGTFRGLYKGTFLALDFSLLGRLPFAIGNGNASIFPLLGIGANIVLSARTLNGDDVADLFGDDHSAVNFSTFRFQFGVGADFNITDSVFFRISALGNYRFAPTLIRDWADEAGENHRGGFGGAVRMGVGFRL